MGTSRHWLAAICGLLLAGTAGAGTLHPNLQFWLRGDQTTNDVSGNGYNVTVTGSTIKTGRIGNCYTNDASDDRLVLASGTYLNYEYTQPMTLCCWLKMGSTAATIKGLICKYHDASPYQGYGIALTTGHKLYMQLCGTGTKYLDVVTTGNALNDGAWHHVAATYSGSGTAAGVVLYVDGVAVGMTVNKDTLGTQTILNNRPLAVSQIYANAAIYGSGCLLDEVMVFNAVLSADQIRTLYGSQSIPGVR